MQTLRTICCLILPVLLLPGMARGKPPEPDAAARPGVNELSLQVWALQRLHDLDLTPEQLQALRAAAPETTEHPPRQRNKIKVSDKYLTTLRSLREALIKGDDDDRIAELQDDVEAMQEDDDLDIDDDVILTDAARAKAPEFLKSLAPSQIAGYVAAYQDEAPDPVQTLMDAADDARDADADEVKSILEDVSDDLGTLLGGLEPAKAKPHEEAVRAWLKKAKAMSDADFKAKRGELERSARELTAGVDPFMVLRHWVQRDVAELLTNPQLTAAIEAKAKSGN
jgi:hypothetical protein